MMTVISDQVGGNETLSWKDAPAKIKMVKVSIVACVVLALIGAAVLSYALINAKTGKGINGLNTGKGFADWNKILTYAGGGVCVGAIASGLVLSFVHKCCVDKYTLPSLDEASEESEKN